MIASQEDSGAVMGINRLQVTLTRQDLAAQWQCRVHSPALSSHLVAHLNVDVHGISSISDVILFQDFILASIKFIWLRLYVLKNCHDGSILASSFRFIFFLRFNT